MKVDTAIRVRDLSLRAIEAITEALNVALADSQGDEAERLRKGAGISIGTIDVRFLRVVYDLFPELDHLGGDRGGQR